MNKKELPSYSSHYIGTGIVSSTDKLFECQRFIDFLNPLFEQSKVQNLGVLTHIFENGSFSLVVMLAESHISVHTWPEKKSVQLDVFLCNYIRDNSALGQNLFDQIIEYFEPTERFISVVERI